MAQCMFRSLSSQAPPYLSRLFSYVSCHHNTRSSFTYHLIFPWSGLHSDRRHSVLPVLPSGAAYLQLFVQHLTSASTILQNYANVFILMHERQFVLSNNMHTTELTILFYLFIYYLFIVHIVVFVLGAFVVDSGNWPPQIK